MGNLVHNVLGMMTEWFQQHGIKQEQIYIAVTDEDHSPAIWKVTRKVVDRLALGVKLLATSYLPGPDEVFFSSINIFVTTRGSHRSLADRSISLSTSTLGEPVSGLWRD